MVIGSGTSVPSKQLFFDPPACLVITATGAPDPTTGRRPPIYVKELAPWSAVRNAAHSYSFAAFAVDPGSHRGGFITIGITYYDVVGTDGLSRPDRNLHAAAPPPPPDVSRSGASRRSAHGWRVCWWPYCPECARSKAAPRVPESIRPPWERRPTCAPRCFPAAVRRGSAGCRRRCGTIAGRGRHWHCRVLG